MVTRYVLVVQRWPRLAKSQKGASLVSQGQFSIVTINKTVAFNVGNSGKRLFCSDYLETLGSKDIAQKVSPMMWR